MYSTAPADWARKYPAPAEGLDNNVHNFYKDIISNVNIIVRLFELAYFKVIFQHIKQYSPGTTPFSSVIKKYGNWY